MAKTVPDDDLVRGWSTYRVFIDEISSSEAFITSFGDSTVGEWNPAYFEREH